MAHTWNHGVMYTAWPVSTLRTSASFPAFFLLLFRCINIATFIPPCNCTLHYSYDARSTFKAGKTFTAGHRWYVANLVANFPSGEVDWGWLANVGWLFSPVIKYSSSFCKDTSGVCKSRGQTQWFSCFRGMTYVALTLFFTCISVIYGVCEFKFATWIFQDTKAYTWQPKISQNGTNFNSMQEIEEFVEGMVGFTGMVEILMCYLNNQIRQK